MVEGPRIHVLVVDDCVLDRKIVEKLLLKNGVFKVTTADSGDKALGVLGLNEDDEKIEFPGVDASNFTALYGLDIISKLAGNGDNMFIKFLKNLLLEDKKERDLLDSKIDIILTDYCMPRMNGYDLLRAVKEHKKLKSIPVVLMSSENDPQRISRCRDIGAEDFILKPLIAKDIQKLRDYVGPTVTTTPKVGIKRKMTLDIMPDSSDSERRTHPAGLAVA